MLHLRIATCSLTLNYLHSFVTTSVISLSPFKSTRFCAILLFFLLQAELLALSKIKFPALSIFTCYLVLLPDGIRPIISISLTGI